MIRTEERARETFDRLREVVDPLHELPSTVLRPVGRRSDNILEITDYEIVATDPGTNIGVAELHFPVSSKDAWFSRAEIMVPGFSQRGYGIVSHLYGAAISLAAGREFRNDPTGISKDALAVWGTLAVMGVAEIVQPLQHDGSRGYPYIGHVRIPLH